MLAHGPIADAHLRQLDLHLDDLGVLRDGYRDPLVTSTNVTRSPAPDGEV